MKSGLLSGLLMLLMSVPAWGQSLKPESPAPLQPGLNKSTADNMVGTQYWWFTGGPGKTHVHVTFTPMGLFGNAHHGDITVTLFDEGRTWHTAKILSSDEKLVECTFDGDFKKATKVLVSVAPPSGGLIRMGGNYEIVVTGDAGFGEKSNQDPVVGTYKSMSGYTVDLGNCKFSPDGTIQTTSGAAGNWKLFDRDSSTYIINIERQDRQSLQYRAGRGLCDSQESIVFQELR
jgi:hypothetical protein